MFMCTSSSDWSQTNLSAAISFSISRKPRAIISNSSAERIPALARAEACAMDPAIPPAHGLRAARCECDRSRYSEFWREAHRRASANSDRAEQRTPGSANLLGRKRAHDFLEARIATQRIPPWVKTQLTVAEIAGQLYGDLQLLQGQVLLASHRVNDREILNYSGSSNRIFDYLKELDCAPP